MVKDNDTVIQYGVVSTVEGVALIENREFNELVNMSSDELEEWLKEEQSEGSGWSKDDGSGETVGHERFVSKHYFNLYIKQQYNQYTNHAGNKCLAAGLHIG